jgi:hypothetical protein
LAAQILEGERTNATQSSAALKSINEKLNLAALPYETSLTEARNTLSEYKFKIC